MRKNELLKNHDVSRHGCHHKLFSIYMPLCQQLTIKVKLEKNKKHVSQCASSGLCGCGLIDGGVPTKANNHTTCHHIGSQMSLNLDGCTVEHDIAFFHLSANHLEPVRRVQTKTEIRKSVV